jgi:hypothetical protein
MPTTRSHPTELSLRIILSKPTAGVDFALQQGHGRPFETVQKQRSKGSDLKFEFTVGVKAAKDGSADFRGAYVQGPAGERFVYVNIGTYAGQTDTPWSRRLKIPLMGIDWAMVDLEQTLTATIPGAGKDGSPNCAYAWRRDVDKSWGWKASKQR